MRIDEIDSKINYMLSLDPWTFDQTDKGWRSLPLNQQAIVLKKYIDMHVENGKFKNLNFGKNIESTILMWHLGQILAFQGNINDAINWMSISKDDDPDWNDYVNATIAFLKKDKAAFNKIDIQNNSNAETLARLKNNWTKQYKDVY